jgi:hypothetical protein
MKQILLPLALCLSLASPGSAQDIPPALPSDTEDGLGLIERGMRDLFDGFRKDIGPAVAELTEAMKTLQPMAQQLAALLEDTKYYEQPERLENGDIIIRRKADAPPPPPPLGAPPADAPVAPPPQIDL